MNATVDLPPVCVKTLHCPGLVHYQWNEFQEFGSAEVKSLIQREKRSGRENTTLGGADRDISCAGEDTPRPHSLLPVSWVLVPSASSTYLFILY